MHTRQQTEHINHPTGPDQTSHINSLAFRCVYIDRRLTFELLTIGAGIVDKVGAPAQRRLRPRVTGGEVATAFLPGMHLQPSCTLGACTSIFAHAQPLVCPETDECDRRLSTGTAPTCSSWPSPHAHPWSALFARNTDPSALFATAHNLDVDSGRALRRISSEPVAPARPPLFLLMSRITSICRSRPISSLCSLASSCSRPVGRLTSSVSGWPNLLRHA
jgi:hypothetical protein